MHTSQKLTTIFDKFGNTALTTNLDCRRLHFQVWCGSYTDSALLNQVLTNPHSPGKYRVLGPLSNSPDFIEQYQCAPGTPMNRPDKCLLW